MDACADFSSREVHFGESFKGRIVPFGTRILWKCLGPDLGESAAKFEETLREGLFMGCHLHSGGRRFGDYLVIDAAAHAKNPDGDRCHVHRVKNIAILGGRPVSPVREGFLRHRNPKKRKLISLQTSRPLGVPAQGGPARLCPADWDYPRLPIPRTPEHSEALGSRGPPLEAPDPLASALEPDCWEQR
eukprot:5478524-Pyramimonas_sp.AAC.1